MRNGALAKVAVLALCASCTKSFGVLESSHAAKANAPEYIVTPSSGAPLEQNVLVPLCCPEDNVTAPANLTHAFGFTEDAPFDKATFPAEETPEDTNTFPLDGTPEDNAEGAPEGSREAPPVEDIPEDNTSPLDDTPEDSSASPLEDSPEDDVTSPEELAPEEGTSPLQDPPDDGNATAQPAPFTGSPLNPTAPTEEGADSPSSPGVQVTPELTGTPSSEDTPAYIDSAPIGPDPRPNAPVELTPADTPTSRLAATNDEGGLHLSSGAIQGMVIGGIAVSGIIIVAGIVCHRPTASGINRVYAMDDLYPCS
ncbi:hypothetical protein DIPPA_51191 [Diplonema papillatum]|nr:hypothetical protein DIPPA_51191 [Diplonema papillatum]